MNEPRFRLTRKSFCPTCGEPCRDEERIKRRWWMRALFGSARFVCAVCGAEFLVVLGGDGRMGRPGPMGLEARTRGIEI